MRTVELSPGSSRVSGTLATTTVELNEQGGTGVLCKHEIMSGWGWQRWDSWSDGSKLEGSLDGVKHRRDNCCGWRWWYECKIRCWRCEMRCSWVGWPWKLVEHIHWHMKLKPPNLPISAETWFAGNAESLGDHVNTSTVWRDMQEIAENLKMQPGTSEHVPRTWKLKTHMVHLKSWCTSILDDGDTSVMIKSTCTYYRTRWSKP